MDRESSAGESPVLRGSTLVRVTRDGMANSRLVAAVDRFPERPSNLPDRIGDPRAGSRLVALARRLSARVATAHRASTLSRSVATVERWARGSYGYRWLTAEPDPDVIVIDLRDTVTVGPIIALLDRFVRALIPAAHRSTIANGAIRTRDRVLDAPLRVLGLLVFVAVLANLLASVALGGLATTGLLVRAALLVLSALATRSTRSWADLRETRAVRLLIAALEPPEPPEGVRNDPSESTATASDDGERSPDDERNR